MARFKANDQIMDDKLDIIIAGAVQLEYKAKAIGGVRINNYFRKLMILTNRLEDYIRK